MTDDDTSPLPSSEPSRGSLLRRLAQLLRGDSTGKTIRESLEQAIEQVGRDGDALSPQERQMLANLLKFGELRVDDVMVPRADIVAVDESVTLNELLAAFREAQHSRLPLYRETLDDPVGLIHIKDVLSLLEPQADGSMRWPELAVSRIKRDLLFVPPSMSAHELLLKMQSSHMHLALVIDEYGGTDGLVSIEDLVEEIVGDIDDEHDIDDTPQLRQLPDGGYDVDARFDLEDFRDQTGIALSPLDLTEDVNTLGGLVMSRLGRVAQRGEIVPYPPDYEFEVLEADPRRIKRLRLRPVTRATAAKSP
jgi:CBS domain containing-hemolysin-like protein